MILAAVVYAVFWVVDRRNRAAKKQSHKPSAGPIGPDDDEDFLAELERKRRHDG